VIRVIAHFMHEHERDMAQQVMTDAQVAEGYLVGEVAEAQIPSLEAAGLIVETLDEEVPLETPGRDWEVLPGVERPGAQRGIRGGLEPVGLEATIDASGPNFYLIQLKGPLMETWRKQLDGLGVELLEYIPYNAYTARLTVEQVAAVTALDFVRRLRLYTATDTGLPAAATRDLTPAAGEEEIGTYDARLHRAEDLPGVLEWLDENNVEVVGSSGRKVRLRLPLDDLLLDELAGLPEVASLEEFVPPQLHNDVARVLLGIDHPPAGPEGPDPAVNLLQTGEGQIVAVADTGLDEEHPDFAGCIVGIVALGRPGDASDPHGHGTHVAGSVLGRGTASGERIRGTAPRASLFFQSVLDASGGLGGLPLDLGDLFEEAYQTGARIHNNSWGAATESAYTFNSIEVDEFIARRRDMLVIISAGNEGQASDRFHTPPGFVDWLSIGSPASSKNALTVGASRSSRTTGGFSELRYHQAFSRFPDPPIGEERVSGNPQGMAAFSSRGPCDDRRIKPDVVAPGTDIVSARSAAAPLRHFWGAYEGNSRYAYMGGTSMAAPLVAGCAALVREYYVNSRDHQPSAALLKATLINSTHRLTAEDALADHDLVPNFHQGFGCVYMPWAIPNPAEPDLQLEFVDGWQDPELQLDRNGQRLRFGFRARAGRPLRLCLTWTDLPARSLQNNLNLFVQLPTRTKITGNPDLPAKLTATDRDNNVEIVRLEAPPEGEYLVQITASNLLRGPQDFALVVTGDLETPLTRQ
jgi:serine protease AprX